MAMRFRRPTLVAIMLVCLLVISWIHLGDHDADDIPLPPLQQAPWPESTWQSWQSHEGVMVYWQSRAQPTGQIHLVTPEQAQPQRIATLNKDSAVPELLSQLNPATAQVAIHDQASLLLIHGPWNATDMHTLAAIVIHQWQLKPWPSSTTHIAPGIAPDLAQCIATHRSAAAWWAEQQGLSWYQHAQLDRSAVMTHQTLPNRAEWQAWRSQQSREWYQRALSDDGQVDIQANLAYHRLSYRQLAQWYDDLARSQAQQVVDFQQCLVNLVEMQRG